ncbi:hypothetical protein GF385_04765 [Candidatus Dependentiae bacterium]|nr:hypothetical protein [Candidatus Dependentiae bacterium]
MIRKLVLSIFIFTLAFGAKFSYAKVKHHGDKKEKIESCKFEKKDSTAPSKKSRLYKYEKSGKDQTSKKKSWFSNVFGSKRKMSKEGEKNKKANKLKNYRIKKAERKARKAQWREERELREKEADRRRAMREERLAEEKRMQKIARKKAMKQWKAIHMADLEQDYADGQYADLYKRPAWPFHMLYADNTNLMEVSAGFEHETNFFTSDGSTLDLSASVFGEKEFTFRDILLALDLNKRIVGATSVLDEVDNNYPWEHLAAEAPGGGHSGLYNKKLIFFSEQNQYDFHFNYGRYIKDKDVFIGFEVPVVYKNRRLKFDTDVVPCNGVNEATVDDVYLRTFQRELFEYILAAKDMTYREKVSTIGLGDFATFINFKVNTKFVEVFKWGAKIVWPTAKDPSTTKLWDPEVGKGFTQFKVFGSVMFNKQSSYFNPHMFAQVTYLWAGHKNKRVPKVITYDGGSNGDVVGTATMALGDRVEYNDIAFTEPDTRIVAFSDNVKSVKIRPGAEFNVRIGNIWEKLILRRAFLDVYYDFRAKLKDRVLNSGLNEFVWQVHRLEENTMQLEHKAGIDFSYQYDIHSRLNVGAEYTFAGINVPDTFRANIGLIVEF